VSPTIQQRAQVLYLHQVEGSSLRMVARMTGLSRFAVRGVLHQALKQDASAVAKRPASKGHVERPLHDVRAHFREKGTS
jgi:DNA-directed RNA polymerase specialized sigma24 family protein